MVDDLAAKVKSRLDSSPELKQTLEELQRNTVGLADRCVCRRAMPTQCDLARYPQERPVRN